MDSVAHSQMSKARKATRTPRKAAYVVLPQSHDCCDHALCLQSGACPHTLCPYYLGEMQKRVWELEEALKRHACCDHSGCEEVQRCAHTICPYFMKEVEKRLSALAAQHDCCDHSLCKEARQCTHDICPFLQEEVRERMSVLEAWSAQKDKELSEAKNGAKEPEKPAPEEPQPKEPEPKKPEPEKPSPSPVR